MVTWTFSFCCVRISYLPDYTEHQVVLTTCSQDGLITTETITGHGWTHDFGLRQIIVIHYHLLFSFLQAFLSLCVASSLINRRMVDGHRGGGWATILVYILCRCFIACDRVFLWRFATDASVLQMFCFVSAITNQTVYIRLGMRVLCREPL